MTNNQKTNQPKKTGQTKTPQYSEDLKGWISTKKDWSPQPASSYKKAQLRPGELAFGSATASRDTTPLLFAVDFD